MPARARTGLSASGLLAIWYTTKGEQDPLLTVLASRLRAGGAAWDPSSEFFKAADRNMHGSAILHDGQGTIYHFNGMAPELALGWSRLALLLRTSTDNGVSWSVARPISSGAASVKRHQVIAGPIRMKDGTLVLACDATPGGEGPSANCSRPAAAPTPAELTPAASPPRPRSPSRPATWRRRSRPTA
jgi:formylglycine-generating enzyme